jgi:hypothetical protein
MRGATVCDLEIFRDLVGEEAMRNVLIIISKQDLITEALREERISQLQENPTFLKQLCDNGARIHRGSREEALVSILRQNLPKALKVQQEMGDENKKLADTAAGGVIVRGLNKKLQKDQDVMEVNNDKLSVVTQKRLRLNREKQREDLHKAREVMNRDKYGLMDYIPAAFLLTLGAMGAVGLQVIGTVYRMAEDGKLELILDRMVKILGVLSN